MKYSGHIIGVAVILFLFPLLTVAQTPSVTTSVDKNKILIGEQIDLSVGVTMPDNRYRLSWLSVPSEFGTFVLASQSKIDTAYQTGVLRYTQKLQITSFDSGRQVVPPLAFQFETISGDSSFRMLTDSIPIDVMFSPADSVLPFHDIKPIISVKKEVAWWFWPAIIAGVLLLILILVLYLRYRKKKQKSHVFESSLSDFDEAMKMINDLHAENLPAKGEFKLYFLRLTDIFKRYISRNTSVNNMHLTGQETIDELSHRITDRKLIEGFASCVRMADAVKFAKFKPSLKESEECIKQVSAVIEALNSQKPSAEDDL